jgi:hypothetical protein
VRVATAGWTTAGRETGQHRTVELLPAGSTRLVENPDTPSSSGALEVTITPR